MKRATATGIMALSLLAGLSGCADAGDRIDPGPTSPATQAPKSLQWMRAQVNSVLDAVACVRIFTIDDDVYFWDRAVGADCQFGDGSWLSVMAYQHGGSVKSALQPWDGRLSSTSPLLVSDHIIVSASRVRLTALLDRLPRLGELITELPPEPWLTTEQQSLTDCVSFVASHLANYASGELEPATDIAELNTIFPGYADLVHKLERSPLMEHYRGLEDREPDAAEPMLSKFGPEAKRNCVESIARRADESGG